MLEVVDYMIAMERFPIVLLAVTLWRERERGADYIIAMAQSATVSLAITLRIPEEGWQDAMV